MLTTKNLVSKIGDVPEIWIYSFYLKQSITDLGEKILSPFTKEKTPSFHFFISSNKIRYKDFSSGKSGDAIDLVKELYSLTAKQAYARILEDYNTYILQNGKLNVSDFKVASNYKLQNFELREWNTDDKKFWYSFHIGFKTLKKFNVKPLEYYILQNGDDAVTITGKYLYGYFKEDGTLYKIYQPYNQKYKFIKLEAYIQGSEQIENKSYLIYMKALKDIMCLSAFKLNVDLKAPDSENTLLPENVIKQDLKSYKKVLCFFDVDSAGIKSAMKYKEKYGIEPIFLNYGEKDLSDHIRRYGARKIYNILIPIINKLINE